jgi:selenide,water dikinase
VWATPAAPPDLLRTSGLSVDAGGFLQVGETLQSLGDPAVFGTGDCVSFTPLPQLARNGVYAVRQGRVLFDNVREFLHDRPLAPFQPQRNCLCLMNSSDGEAILSYGPLATKGRFIRRLKEHIDREWLASFTPAPPMRANVRPDSTSPSMRCGGCGAKVSGDVLSSVLCTLDVPDDPRVLLGMRAGEDAAVHRVRAEAFGIAPDDKK